jgi:two-component system response regulator PilR (NtrC family)
VGANTRTDAPPAPDALGADSLPADLKSWLADQEKQIMTRALEQTGFNRTTAATMLGLTARQIRYRMLQLGIHDPTGGDGDSDGDDDDDEGTAG